MYYIGSGFLGSEKLETSVANQEIIPTRPNNWTMPYQIYSIDFLNLDSCSVRINGEKPIHLEAYQGFHTNLHDRRIHSFIIVEENIRFTWTGKY